MSNSVYDHDIKELEARLDRLEARSAQGKSAASHISVDIDTLWQLIQDHKELVRREKEAAS